jgi:hypothetical protein
MKMPGGRVHSRRSLLLDLSHLDAEARKTVLQVLKAHEAREASLRAEVGRLREELRTLGARRSHQASQTSAGMGKEADQ